jgi:hypothetical protein
VTENIFIDNHRRDSIYVDPVADGLSDHGAKLLVIKYIGLILYYRNCENQTRLMNNDNAKECTTHLSNVTWE